MVINLFRTSFGAKFVVTGLAVDGTLTATCGEKNNDNNYYSGTDSRVKYCVRFNVGRKVL